MKQPFYNSISELPNKRGVYVVMCDFKHDSELCQVRIDFDVDEELDVPITNAYCYVVEDLDCTAIYAAQYGFKSIKAMLLEISPRLKDVE